MRQLREARTRESEIRRSQDRDSTRRTSRPSSDPTVEDSPGGGSTTIEPAPSPQPEQDNTPTREDSPGGNNTFETTSVQPSPSPQPDKPKPDKKLGNTPSTKPKTQTQEKQEKDEEQGGFEIAGFNGYLVVLFVSAVILILNMK